MIDKNKLKVGMKALVKGKYDFKPYIVEIIEFGKNHITHKSAMNIITCHQYKDIIEIVE